MNTTFLEQVGQRLRYLRECKRHSTQWLGWRCGISETLISNIETGRYKPPYSLYEDMCITMGYTTRELFGFFRWVYTPPVEGEGEGDNADSRRIA